MFTPAELGGIFQQYAAYIAVALILLIALLANERAASAFTIAVGVVLGFLMGLGWVPANYMLVGVIILAGVIGVAVSGKNG